MIHTGNFSWKSRAIYMKSFFKHKKLPGAAWHHVDDWPSVFDLAWYVWNVWLVSCHVFFTGRCGARQPGAGPDLVSDHRLRLVPLRVKINHHYHNFMTFRGAITHSALADINILEVHLQLLGAIWFEMYRVFLRCKIKKKKCLVNGALGPVGEGGWAFLFFFFTPRLLSSHSPYFLSLFLSLWVLLS